MASRILFVIAIFSYICSASEDLLFFCKSDSCTAKVTKDDKFLEVLEVSDGESSQRIKFKVGQQFFLTAEFLSLGRKKIPELVVYNEWGTGLQSLIFRENSEKKWVQVFEHVAKARVQFFYMTDSMQAAICDEGNGNMKKWHYSAKSINDWTIDENTDKK